MPDHVSTTRDSFARSVAHSLAKAQRVDKQRERWRVVPAARVIKVVARERRRPTFKDPGQSAGSNIRLQIIVRQISDAEAVERGFAQERNVVDDELAFDADIQGAIPLLKFPRIEST